MPKTGTLIAAVVLFIVGITAYSALYTVRQDQQALILQFGNPVGVEQTPGLKVKMPFIQDVTYYDRRILDLDPPVQSVNLRDQRRVNVDSFARYRIVDPLEFRKRASTDANFRTVFGGRLNSAVRSEIGNILLPDMLSEKRAEVMSQITDQMKAQAPEFGVEVIDVRIGRTDLPAETAQAVYSRMKSDREAEATELRAQGQEQATRIRAEAERGKTVILANAERDAQIIRGQGDGERTRVLNDAYGRDAEFFDFYRSLDALGNSINDGTSMVLSPESELFQFFDSLKLAPGR